MKDRKTIIASYSIVNKSNYRSNSKDDDLYDEDGFDQDGFDEDGFDRDGYDEYGYDKDGYDKFGEHRDKIEESDDYSTPYYEDCYC